MQQIITLPTIEAAKVLNISPRTLERWRQEGRGPPYLKLGSRVVYSFRQLTLWLDEQQHLLATNEIN